MSRLSLLAEFSLPIPPSVNHYKKRTKNGGVMLADKSREYKRDVYQQVGCQAPHKPSVKRLAGEFKFYPADKRKFDLDNRMKLILDSLEDAGFYADDEQFDEIVLKRMPKDNNGGRVDVMICEYG